MVNGPDEDSDIDDDPRTPAQRDADDMVRRAEDAIRILVKEYGIDEALLREQMGWKLIKKYRVRGD